MYVPAVAQVAIATHMRANANTHTSHTLQEGATPRPAVRMAMAWTWSALRWCSVGDLVVSS